MAANQRRDSLTLRMPLWVILPRKTKADKKFALNLNVYRNSHYQILNNAKKTLKEILASNLMDLGIKDLGDLKPPFCFTYTLYPPTRRLVDLGNVLSIVQKFCDDALIDLGLIEDDNYQILRKVIYEFGWIDKENPRAELRIDEISPEEIQKKACDG